MCTYPLSPEVKFSDDKFAELWLWERQKIHKLVYSAEELISSKMSLKSVTIKFNTELDTPQVPIFTIIKYTFQFL